MNAFAASRGWKKRFCPRMDILTEVTAGWLWLLLPLPADISRAEVEGIARRLVKAMMEGMPPNRMAVEVAKLQADVLCIPPDIGAARTIAARIAQLVRSL